MDASYFAGFMIGAIVAVYCLSLLFRYALLGKGGGKVQHLWMVMLAGIVAIGLLAFGGGVGGFLDRMTNPPNFIEAGAYALSTLVVALIVIWKMRGNNKSTDSAVAKASWIGRSIALAFVVPMVIIGLGNIAGSGYRIAAGGLPLTQNGLGVTHAELRQIMLNGDMAQFWKMIDAKVPDDLDYIAARILDDESSYTSSEDVLSKLNFELINYRISLAIYAPALTDEQRKSIIDHQTYFLKEFQNDPKMCAVVAAQGATALTQEQLLAVKNVFNDFATTVIGLLIDARHAASNGSMLPTPPSEDDYALLIDEKLAKGYSENQLQALFEVDASDPSFCDITIGFLETVRDLSGRASESIRFETTQAILTTAQ